MKTINEVTMVEVDGLCAWLRKMIGNRIAIVGISGGVDSSVVAALCVRALGENRVLAVRMPCGEDRDAPWTELLLDHLPGICQVTINILDPCEATKMAICEAEQLADISLLVWGNLQARERMKILYALSNMHHGIVVGTTNASENVIGYLTKYGDGGVDIEPLREFCKGEVRVLGRLLGLSPWLVDRMPTAGLWAGQTDEGEIGLSYAVIDAYLRGEDVPLEQLKQIQQMRDASWHKRCMPTHYSRELR